MAVSQKIKPKAVDLSAQLNMLSNPEPKTVEQTQIQTEASVASPVSKVKAVEETPAATPLPTTKDTQIIFRTTESNKNSLKGFFASYGFTLSKGIQLACFYLEQEIKAGNITMGPAGIVKKER